VSTPDPRVFGPAQPPPDGLVLSENLSGEFITNWFCEPPPLGGRFRCLRDEWLDGSPPQRNIYEIEVLP
jgi:hypothetical protein